MYIVTDPIPCLPGPGSKPAEQRNIEYLEDVAVGIARSDAYLHV